MNLDIVTPDADIFSGEVTGVKVPGIDGSFEVLNNHAPIVSSLEKGLIRLASKDGKVSYEIDGGVIEVMNNKVIILAETAKEVK